MPPAVASLEGRVTNSPFIANGVVAVYFSRLSGRLRQSSLQLVRPRGPLAMARLRSEKILGVPEKQYIVGDCDYLLVTLAASKAAEVVGGFDHIDSGTRCVTYVDACIQNVNWTDVPVCPSSGVAATDGSLNRREVSGNGTSFTRPHRTPGTSIEWRV
jgi:hypothetical protein